MGRGPSCACRDCRAEDAGGRSLSRSSLRYVYTGIKREIFFVWDESKNRQNRKKHGVSFEEAESVFFDETAREFFDPDRSEEEERFLLVGQS